MDETFVPEPQRKEFRDTRRATALHDTIDAYLRGALTFQRGPHTCHILFKCLCGSQFNPNAQQKKLAQKAPNTITHPRLVSYVCALNR